MTKVKIDEKARLRQFYIDHIRKELLPQYSNPMEVPQLKKIVVHVTTRDAVADHKVLDLIQKELMLITGQKPVLTRAKKSIAAFKLRTGMPVGCVVTIRGDRMYEFLDRLVNIALPRVRDFRGLSSKGFDGRGSMSFGIKEQIIFPEIDYDKVSKIRGMDVTIVTSAKNPEQTKKLLQMFNLPFSS